AQGGKPRSTGIREHNIELALSCLICAKRRSRSPRFDTSPCTPVTFLPISFTAAANSGSRRPVTKTYAPSFANCFAVARPMPLLPPVMSVVFPSSLPITFSLVVFFAVLRRDDSSLPHDARLGAISVLRPSGHEAPCRWKLLSRPVGSPRRLCCILGSQSCGPAVRRFLPL